MATNKNITMKQYNGLDYDTLYPKTTPEQVGAVSYEAQTLTDAQKTRARGNISAMQGIESTDHPGCYYVLNDSKVEWVNPPMNLGTEYRTTERYLGEPVYVKLVDCGTLPAQGTYKEFVFASDVNSIISVTAYSPMRGNTLPYYDTNGVKYSIAGRVNTVTIWNYSESLLDTDVRALIKYTKTTN